MLYDLVMRSLAITGFTWIFFDSKLYSDAVHQTGQQSVAVLAARWLWFGKRCGDDTPFPAEFDEMPGVPNCFSYVWMVQSKSRLRLRMALTVSIFTAMIAWFDPDLKAYILALTNIMTEVLSSQR